MHIKIYQILRTRGEAVRFKCYHELKAYQGSDKVDAKNYDIVFDGEVEEAELEEIFKKFPLKYKPEDFPGRYLCVSDVFEVVSAESEDPGFYYCDLNDFIKIAFDVEKAKTHFRAKTINVLFLEPGKEPVTKEIVNDGIYAKLFKGPCHEEWNMYDDPVHLFKMFTCWDHKDEGPINRIIYKRVHNEPFMEIYGTCFLSGYDGDFPTSISDEMLERYTELLRYPVLETENGFDDPNKEKILAYVKEKYNE